MTPQELAELDRLRGCERDAERWRELERHTSKPLNSGDRAFFVCPLNDAAFSTVEQLRAAIDAATEARTLRTASTSEGR